MQNSQWLNAERLEQEAQRLEASVGDDTKPLEYTLLSHQELLDLKIPPMMWVMNMMIPNPGLVVLSGRPGSYKTFLALWLGLRASEGKALFEEYDEPYFCQTTSNLPMGKVPTLFIEEENSKQLIKERAHGFKVFPVKDMFYMIDEGFKFTNEAWRTEIHRIIEEKGIKLLILDPFSSVMGLDNENDNAEVAKIMDIVRKEFVKLGLTVILIHHPSKGDGDGKNLRGAGDILGKCDVHLCLEIDNESEKIIKVTYEKLRVADKSRVSNFKMRLTGDSLMRDLSFRYIGVAKSKTEEDREALENRLLTSIQDGEERTQTEIAELVDQQISNKMFIAVWKRLLQEKKILRNATTKKFHIPLVCGSL